MGQCFSSAKRASEKEAPSQVYQAAHAAAQQPTAQQEQQLHHQQWLQYNQMQQQHGQTPQAGQPPQAQYATHQSQQGIVASASASTHSGSSVGSSNDTILAPSPDAQGSTASPEWKANIRKLMDSATADRAEAAAAGQRAAAAYQGAAAAHQRAAAADARAVYHGHMAQTYLNMDTRAVHDDFMTKACRAYQR